MTVQSLPLARRNRWAISFADLLLLLLAFFVLLQASGSRRDAMLSHVSRQFGGQPMAQGAALRAAYTHHNNTGTRRTWKEVVAPFTQPLPGSTIQPDPAAVSVYAALLPQYRALEEKHTS